MSTPVIPKSAASVFAVIYISAFCIGVFGLITLPKEEDFLRTVALGMSYVFGLPILLVGGMQILQKLGIWNGK